MKHMSTKSKARHTPGPWMYRNDFPDSAPDDAQLFRITSQKHTHGLAICGAESDARLISLCPEMLEILKQTRNMMLGLDMTHFDEYEAINSLISRAEGGE